MLESLPWLLRAVTAHNRLICRDIRELSPILFFCTFPLFLWFFNKLLADYEQSCKCDGEEYDSASVTQGKVSLRITNFKQKKRRQSQDQRVESLIWAISKKRVGQFDDCG